MSNVSIEWFEIPAVDVARATEFYGAVLNTPLGKLDGPDGEMNVFMGPEGPAGALLPVDEAPASGGVTIYLGCDDIDAALIRAEQAGGQIEQVRTSIGPHGFIGRFTDTEGNSVALHTGI
ncbi:MAG: VOC family protein [Pseudomonadota bacterium]